LPAYEANRRFAAGKNVVEQNTTKGIARLVFCGTRAAEQAAQQLPFVIRRLRFYRYIFYTLFSDVFT